MFEITFALRHALCHPMLLTLQRRMDVSVDGSTATVSVSACLSGRKDSSANSGVGTLQSDRRTSCKPNVNTATFHQFNGTSAVNSHFCVTSASRHLAGGDVVMSNAADESKDVGVDGAHCCVSENHKNENDLDSFACEVSGGKKSQESMTGSDDAQMSVDGCVAKRENLKDPAEQSEAECRQGLMCSVGNSCGMESIIAHSGTRLDDLHDERCGVDRPLDSNVTLSLGSNNCTKHVEGTSQSDVFSDCQNCSTIVEMLEQFCKTGIPSNATCDCDNNSMLSGTCTWSSDYCEKNVGDDTRDALTLSDSVSKHVKDLSESLKSHMPPSVSFHTADNAHQSCVTCNVAPDNYMTTSCPSRTSVSVTQSVTGAQLLLSRRLPAFKSSGPICVPSNAHFLGTVSSISSSMPPSFLLSTTNSVSSHASICRPNIFTQHVVRHSVAISLLPQVSRQLSTTIPFIKPKVVVAPEKPTSSMAMIDMIRWEVENNLSVKPKYVKPNPTAALGNFSKWVFDLGNDLVKGYVYRDIVRHHSPRSKDSSLAAQEKSDFVKMQKVNKEMDDKIGHLKFKLTKSCRCGFKADLDSILYEHTQWAIVERGGFLYCQLCKFCTRHSSAFRLHMENEHGRIGKIESRQNVHQCSLCLYETNYQDRLERHSMKCQRQYKEVLNLHPSYVTGPHVNICLENVFYFVFTQQLLNSVLSQSITMSSSRVCDMQKLTTVAVAAQSTCKSVSATYVSSSKAKVSLLPATTKVVFGSKMSTHSPLTCMSTTTVNNFLLPSTSQIRIGPVRLQRPSVVSSITSTKSVTNSYRQLGIRPHVAIRTGSLRQTCATESASNYEVCEICGGYVKDRLALRIHFFYAHRIDMPLGVFEDGQGIPPLFCSTCLTRFWTAQGLQKHIEIHKNDGRNASKHRGLAGKCITCSQDVQNILLHMRAAHSWELKHFLAALMCIFCGKRFVARRQVEQHMSKEHGIITNSCLQAKAQASLPSIKSTPVSTMEHFKVVLPKADSSRLQVYSVQAKQESHHHCVLCNLIFARNVELTRHCMRSHHTCMKCGLVVVDEVSLSRHVCLRSVSGTRSCHLCREAGFHPAYYTKHMRDKHIKKCSVLLRRIDRVAVESLKRPIMISDSEDEESGCVVPGKQLKNGSGHGVMIRPSGKSHDMIPVAGRQSKRPSVGKPTFNVTTGVIGGKDGCLRGDAKSADCDAGNVMLTVDGGATVSPVYDVEECIEKVGSNENLDRFRVDTRDVTQDERGAVNKSKYREEVITDHLCVTKHDGEKPLGVDTEKKVFSEGLSQFDKTASKNLRSGKNLCVAIPSSV